MPFLFSWEWAWIFAPFATLAGCAVLTIFVRWYRLRKKAWLIAVGAVCAAVAVAIVTGGIALALNYEERNRLDLGGVLLTVFVWRYAGFLGLGLLAVHGFWPMQEKGGRCIMGAVTATAMGLVFVMQESVGTMISEHFKPPFFFLSFGAEWSTSMIVLAIIIGASYSIFLPSGSSAPEVDRAEP